MKFVSSKVSVDWHPDHTHTVIALSSRLFITGHRHFHSCWSSNGIDHFENGDIHRRCAEHRVASLAFARDLQILVRKTGLISSSMPDGHILIIFPSSENDSTLFFKSSWLHPVRQPSEHSTYFSSCICPCPALLDSTRRTSLPNFYDWQSSSYNQYGMSSTGAHCSQGASPCPSPPGLEIHRDGNCDKVKKRQRGFWRSGWSMTLLLWRKEMVGEKRMEATIRSTLYKGRCTVSIHKLSEFRQMSI